MAGPFLFIIFETLDFPIFGECIIFGFVSEKLQSCLTSTQKYDEPSMFDMCKHGCSILPLK